MKATVFALLSVASVAAGADEFAFKVRATHRAARPVPVEDRAESDGPYRARKGDTLWDVAEQHWKSPFAWPELWSLNPHFTNPHRIAPGDPIFLSRFPLGHTIRLPIESVSAQGAGGDRGAVSPQKAEAVDDQGPPSAALPLHAARTRAGHFVSSHRLARLGVLAAQPFDKDMYAQGEDVALTLSRDSRLEPGDLVTVFDDSVAVTHPVNRTPQGYLVRILGTVRVRTVSGRHASGQIEEAYDVLSEGNGVMGHRAPVTQVTAKAAKADVGGVVLGGMPGQILMSMEDPVFLDRGSLHGLEPGCVLDVPIPSTHGYVTGLVDLEHPIARIVVVTVQDKTATGMVLKSRSPVVAGSRFVAASLSP